MQRLRPRAQLPASPSGPPVDSRARSRRAHVLSRAVLGRDPAEIDKSSTSTHPQSVQPVKVSAKPVSRDIALVLSERAELFPSVRVEAQSIRSYIDPMLYSPLMGYVGAITEEELDERKDGGYLPTDIIGKTGLELVYENYLRGQYGWREIERDAAQREIKTLAYSAPTTGNNLVLTIDDRLQKLSTRTRKGR